MLLQGFYCVDFLHGIKYAHRDLNLGNFFVNGKFVSLGDLGFDKKICEQPITTWPFFVGESLSHGLCYAACAM
jgi:serine/threonine protein kinase